MKSRITLTIGLLAVLVVSLAGTATAQPATFVVAAPAVDSRIVTSNDVMLTG